MPHGSRGRSSWSSLRVFGVAALVSELLVLRYLYARWPLLKHPLEPPTSTSPNPDQSSTTSRESEERITQYRDGYFGGIPVTYNPKSRPSPSSVQCIGENFEPANSWMFRSCRFQNVCFDTQEREFVYLQSRKERELEESLAKVRSSSRSFMTVSTLATANHTVSLGSIHPSMTQSIERTLQWFPKIQKYEEMSSTGYYLLPSNIVVVPFVGSPSWAVVWDDLFPIYTLLSVFGLTKDTTYKQYLIHHGDSSQTDDYIPFLPLIGVKDPSMQTTQKIQLQDSSGKKRSNLVCSKELVAGIGMISDRGFNLPLYHSTSNPAVSNTPHPSSANLFTHNVAQGTILRGFRDYMINNLGYSHVLNNHLSSSKSVKVSIHTQAATILDMVQLKSQVTAFQSTADFHLLDAAPVSSDPNMVKILALTKILLVRCCEEDAALAATFLSNGASLIILYDPSKHGKTLPNIKRAFPIWDLIDNAAYFRTHWISSDAEKSDLLTRIVRTIKENLVESVNG